MTLPQIDETHDPALSSWVEDANGHADFPIQNLPYGIFSTKEGSPRPGVAIGDHVFDLAAASKAGLLPQGLSAVMEGTTLNGLMALAAADRLALRKVISKLLSDESASSTVRPLLVACGDVTMHLPAAIGDYTDFYVGIHHATNIGKLFRPDNPLLPNYKYVPIGYHGRASSIRPSGLPIVRPSGQRKAPDADLPVFGPSVRLDYELELGIWLGRSNTLGEPIAIGDAWEHIVGFCLLNDWSARDIQAWEYIPLGPFLSKSFHSTISPWIVTVEALAPFRTAQPPRPEGDPAPLPYLSDVGDQQGGALAVDLEVLLSSRRMREEGFTPLQLSRGHATSMYWTAQQIVTHHASNGCNLNAGDLLGTGTLSGPTPDSFGSLMELTQGGKVKIALPTGEERLFLEDGDELTLKATAISQGYVSFGFGECRAVVSPAK